MKHTNRYGDVYVFEYNENGNIDWKGDFKYCRFGFLDNPEEITMIDPSGGPYVEIGLDMIKFGMRGVVKGFIEHEDHFELIVK